MKGQKSQLRLARRIKWYEELIARLTRRGVSITGYSKPGSNKK